MKSTLIVFQLLISLSFGAVPLSQNELKEKYGQENTTYNDGKSCYRPCNGTSMTCYYEFKIEHYDTMSRLCGNCAGGVIGDCFKEGCISANGVRRNIMTINRQLPGPAINCCEDDRVIVDVTNHMPGTELSFHWHGVHQSETPWMDGVPMVTQCPIFSGDTFRYMFHVHESGTQYYHAHSGLHRMNGIVGKLNVREQNDPNAEYYDTDLSEHTILFSGWNNFLAEDLLPSNPHKYGSSPASILINGFGNYIEPDSGYEPYAPIAVFYAVRGMRHRFRIDNAASSNCQFEFSIKGHKMAVIALDGSPVEPVTVDTFFSSAGERFDIVMHATKDPNIHESLIIIRGLGGCRRNKLQGYARIIFLNDFSEFSPRNSDHEPLESRPDYQILDKIEKITLNDATTQCGQSEDYCITDLESKAPPSTVENLRDELQYPVSKVYTFQFIKHFDRSDSISTSHFLSYQNFTFITSINNISSTMPPLPILTQDDTDITYCSKDNLPPDCKINSVCYCIHLIELELCKVYEFHFYDLLETVSHPIHMHGHRFQVIEMVTQEQLLNGQTSYKNSTKLPVIKDTVTVPAGGYVKIRFRSCNAGYWFFHCHFELHMHTGMTSILKVGNRSDMVPPPPNFPICGNYLQPVFD
ncbi:laccase-2-like [Contarinia nasturtii]|uniref:laccase-2-like n=1 Tax=Contarinia nasturtii TaxID=265458 RepID=UPI0012D3A5E9|nr:laccase-2-like [Contarinia nasturtii]